MVNITLEKTVAGILVSLVLAGALFTWTFSKQSNTLSKDGEVIARHRWSVKAQRTYISLNSWYRKNVMCPRIIDSGGYKTATRCYYPPQTYNSLNRDLIDTEVTSLNKTVFRTTPYYAYGTSGAHSGALREVISFSGVTGIESFPSFYEAIWTPRDTRNYQLIWRISDLKHMDLEPGTYHDCKYRFKNILIDVSPNCSSLQKAQVKDSSTIWFYFKPARNFQSYNVKLVDPSTGYLDPDGDDTTEWDETTGTDHYTEIDEINGDQDNLDEDDYIGNAPEPDVTDEDIFDMETLSDVDDVTSIKIYVYAGTEEASGPYLDADLYLGSWQGEKEVYDSSGYASQWWSVEWTGLSASQSDLDAMKVKLISGTDAPFPGPSNYVYAMYAEITYTADGNGAGGETISDCTELDISETTYTLDSDIIDSSTPKCLNITAANVTLDCEGHLVDGDTSADYGIYVDAENTTITNCTLTDWDTHALRLNQSNTFLENCDVSDNPDWGVYIGASDNNRITNLNASDNFRAGIYIVSGSHNQIINSTLLNNDLVDIDLSGNLPAPGCDNELIDVHGTGNKPIVWFNKTVNLDGWNNNISSLILCDADHSTVNNINISRSGEQSSAGIDVKQTDYSNFTNITTEGLQIGFDVANSDNNIFDMGTCNNHQGGCFDFFQSSSNTIFSFDASDNWHDFSLSYSNHNIFLKSNSSSSVRGINLNHAHNNTFSNITISSAQFASVDIGSSENNTLYNNFFGSSSNAALSDSIAFWNTSNQTGNRIYARGNYIGGNYWSNPSGTGFSDSCTDSNFDGFCDDYYNVSSESSTTISGTNIDYLPLSDGYGAAPPFYNTTDYSVSGTNQTNTQLYLNVTWSDDNNISHWILSENQSGSWTNHSASSEWIHKVNSWYIAVMDFTITASKGTVFNVIGYANDTSNKWNNTWQSGYGLNIQVTVENTPPTHEKPKINSSSGTNLTVETLQCFNQSTSDIDGDLVTNSYRWFENDNLIIGETDSTLASGNTQKGSNYLCEISISDGTDAGTPKNSTTLTILNSPPTTPTIHFPEDGHNYSDIPYINYSASDPDGDTITYYGYINQTLNFTSTTNISDWNASEGTYNLTVSAYDGTSFSSNSTPVIFTLDTTPPTIYSISVSSTDTTLSVSCNASDDTEWYNISLNTSASSDYITECSYTFTGLSPSTIYNITVQAYDEVNNTAINHTLGATTFYSSFNWTPYGNLAGRNSLSLFGFVEGHFQTLYIEDNITIQNTPAISGNFSAGTCWQYFSSGILTNTNCSTT